MASPDALLADAPIGAAVAALAERNAHHLAQMTEEEQRDALMHWRDLAVTVLTAAGAAPESEEPEATPGGRAVLVFEDSGQDEIAVHATLYPQPEQIGEEMMVTPAQAAALELLQGMADEGGPEGARRPAPSGTSSSATGASATRTSRRCCS